MNLAYSKLHDLCDAFCLPPNRMRTHADVVKQLMDWAKEQGQETHLRAQVMTLRNSGFRK